MIVLSKSYKLATGIFKIMIKTLFVVSVITWIPFILFCLITRKNGFEVMDDVLCRW